MIREALEELILGVDDCCAAVLIAPDGVAVDSIVVDERVDSELLAAGAADLMSRSDRFAAESGSASVDVLIMATHTLTYLVRPIVSGYRLLTVVGPDSHVVSARRALSRTASVLEDELELDESAPSPGVDPGPGATV
ncbi:MAG: roadblock/LC7 domain-containing protein [Acidobacteriota bacterium]